MDDKSVLPAGWLGEQPGRHIGPADDVHHPDGNEVKKKSRRRIGMICKAAVSVALISYLFASIGWTNVWNELRAAHPYLLIGYLLLGGALLFISAVKWHALSAALGMRASLGRLFALYLVGRFFSNFLPTSVGGDIVRAYELGKSEGQLSRSVASIFVERFTGLTTLLVLAITALLTDSRFSSDLRIVGLISGFALCYAVGAALIFNRTVTRTVDRYCGLPLLSGLMRKVHNVQDAIHMYRQRGRSAGLVDGVVLNVLCDGRTERLCGLPHVRRRGSIVQPGQRRTGDVGPVHDPHLARRHRLARVGLHVRAAADRRTGARRTEPGVGVSGQGPGLRSGRRCSVSRDQRKIRQFARHRQLRGRPTRGGRKRLCVPGTRPPHPIRN